MSGGSGGVVLAPMWTVPPSDFHFLALGPLFRTRRKDGSCLPQTSPQSRPSTPARARKKSLRVRCRVGELGLQHRPNPVRCNAAERSRMGTNTTPRTRVLTFCERSGDWPVPILIHNPPCHIIRYLQQQHDPRWIARICFDPTQFLFSTTWGGSGHWTSMAVGR